MANKTIGQLESLQSSSYNANTNSVAIWDGSTTKKGTLRQIGDFIKNTVDRDATQSITGYAERVYSTDAMDTSGTPLRTLDNDGTQTINGSLIVGKTDGTGILQIRKANNRLVSVLDTDSSINGSVSALQTTVSEHNTKITTLEGQTSVINKKINGDDATTPVYNQNGLYATVFGQEESGEDAGDEITGLVTQVSRLNNSVYGSGESGSDLVTRIENIQQNSEVLTHIHGEDLPTGAEGSDFSFGAQGYEVAEGQTPKLEDVVPINMQGTILVSHNGLFPTIGTSSAADTPQYWKINAYGDTNHRTIIATYTEADANIINTQEGTGTPEVESVDFTTDDTYINSAELISAEGMTFGWYWSGWKKLGSDGDLFKIRTIVDINYVIQGPYLNLKFQPNAPSTPSQYTTYFYLSPITGYLPVSFVYISPMNSNVFIAAQGIDTTTDENTGEKTSSGFITLVGNGGGANNAKVAILYVKEEFANILTGEQASTFN